MPSLSGGSGETSWEHRAAWGAWAKNTARCQIEVRGSFQALLVGGLVATNPSPRMAWGGGALPASAQALPPFPPLPREDNQPPAQPWKAPPQPWKAPPRPGPARPRPRPGPTSGWNCCSVRVWQYWQASPFSHLPGSPHSSPCFTLGHGDDLVQ